MSVVDVAADPSTCVKYGGGHRVHHIHARKAFEGEILRTGHVVATAGHHLTIRWEDGTELAGWNHVPAGALVEEGEEVVMRTYLLLSRDDGDGSHRVFTLAGSPTACAAADER